MASIAILMSTKIILLCLKPKFYISCDPWDPATLENTIKIISLPPLYRWVALDVTLDFISVMSPEEIQLGFFELREIRLHRDF